jgi:hypothetical protein
MSNGKKIILAGVAMEILFMLLLGFYGNLLWRIIFILGICLVFLLAYLIFKKNAVSSRILFFFSLLFVLTCIFFPPRGSADINNYAMMSRIAGIYHANPYVVTPDNFSADIFYNHIGEPWRTLPLTYGPLWLLATVPIGVLVGTNLFASAILFKLLAVAFGVGCVFILSLILEVIAPESKKNGLFLMAWNPWLIFEVANNGHNDIMVAFFILLAVGLMVKNKKLWVLPALALAVLVKYAAVILLPIFILWMIMATKNRPSPFFWLKTACICALLFIVCYLPFWQGLETFRGVVIQAKLFGQPFFYPAKLLFNAWGADALPVVKNASLGIFIIFYALIILIYHRWDTNTVIFKILLALAAFLVFGLSYFQPWYVIWLAPLLILVFSKRGSQFVPWLTLAGFMFYIFY